MTQILLADEEGISRFSRWVSKAQACPKLLTPVNINNLQCHEPIELQHW